MAKRLDEMQTLLDNTKRQLENGKIEEDKPFVKEAELSAEREEVKPHMEKGEIVYYRP